MKAERRRDPNWHLKNKSRVRPRQRGKFCKKGKDFVSITRVQAPASDGRLSSCEIRVLQGPPPPPEGRDLSCELEEDDYDVDEGDDSSESTPRPPAGSDRSYDSDDDGEL